MKVISSVFLSLLLILLTFTSQARNIEQADIVDLRRELFLPPMDPDHRGIITHLLELPEMGLSFENIPCLNQEQYERIKTLTGLSDEGLSGELCGDGSYKEKIGKFLNAFMGVIDQIADYANASPGMALKDPEGFSFYDQQYCISEKSYRRYIEALGIDDSNIVGALCGEDSDKERFGKIMVTLNEGFMYFYRSLQYNGFEKTLADPFRFFIEMIERDLKYEGSVYPEPNTAEKVGVTSYDKLPCLDEEDYPFLKTYLNIDDSKLEGELCGDNSNREKFGKLLRYLKTLKVKLPVDWKGGARDALTNPLRYIKSGFNRVSFAGQKGGAIASNGWGSITIYKLFFTQDPLDAIGTLIHESRHSDGNDPGHEKCTSGDRAQQNGACDEWFDSGHTAGAYAYNVSFYYGLSKYGMKSQVSDVDRSMLRSWATSLLSRRFNGVPSFLGLPFELVYFATADGHLYYIHPILKKKVFIQFDGHEHGYFERIKFNRVRNGLYIITDQGRVLMNKKPGHDFELFDEYVIPKDKNVKDVERLTGTKYSETYYITADDKIRKKVFNTEVQRYVSEESLFSVPGEGLSRLYHANKDKRYVLAESGVLYQFKKDANAYGKDIDKAVEGEINTFEASFQDPAGKGWKSLGGGVLFADLFGVNMDGQLFYDQENEDPQEHSLGDAIKVQDYIEGINVALVHQEGFGGFRIKRYGQENDLLFTLDTSGSYEPTKIVSVALTRNFKPSERFKAENKVSREFIDKCNIVKAELDPWAGKGMGINAQNELIFEGERYATCQKYSVHGSIEVTDFRFRGTSVQEPGTFSDAALEILTEGEWKKIYPYDWRPFPIR